MSTHKGSCLCGAIAYKVQNITAPLGYCHCTMCRKFHGAPFSSLGLASLEDFEWLQGEESLGRYVAENGTVRQFCSVCGSSLTFQTAKAVGHSIEIALATLDEDQIALKPDAHIFVADKASWYDIKDGLTQFPQGRKA